jgi:serine/threonine protein kinase
MAPEIPDDLQAALGQRFELRRVLGRGGMATVYLVLDNRHEREVALKVFRPELAATLGTERFLHEIQIAARLTHPHILAVHDSGEAGGFLFYVMPFIEGLSLRQRLEQYRVLEPDQMLAVTAPVADALSYAHRMGVVHRDIKPENILFSQGHPIVADFGIAKAISMAGGANLTRTGFPLGTPGYMSPEQALGLTDLDVRTDVYSLGIVTYEMLTGEVPGRWPTEDAVRLGRFVDAPAHHRALLNHAGARIEGALVRALAVRLDQRTPTPRQFIDELSSSGAARRRYSGDEVQEIVRRAAEMEATNPTQSGAMTMGGVEALAGEVGIAPEMVRSAAKSLTPGSDLPAIDVVNSNPWLGGPTSLLYERVVEGEVPEVEFPVLVAEIRRVMRDVGQVSQLGPSFSWTAGGGAGSSRRDLQVAVTVRAGQTRIVIQEHLRNLIGGIFGGVGGGMGGGGMGPILGLGVDVLGIPGPAFALLIPAWLGITYATARAIYSRVSRKRERTLKELGDRLATVASEMVGAPPLLKGFHTRN